jgi:nucleotide-binding universal stress UspA family protein
VSHPINEILYAADLSPRCEQVLAYAINLARQLGARLRVVAVIDDDRETSVVEVDSYVPQAALNQYHDGHAQRIRAQLEAQIAAYAAERPDLTGDKPIYEIKVHEGDDVAQLVLDETKAAPTDLVILGADSENPILGLLFGSVVQEVIRNSDVPVLLVPGCE